MMTSGWNELDIHKEHDKSEEKEEDDDDDDDDDNGSGVGFRRGESAPLEPEFGLNSAMRMFESRILGPKSGVAFFAPISFLQKRAPSKNLGIG